MKNKYEEIKIEYLNPTDENITIVSNLIKLDTSERCFTNRDLEGNIIPTEEMADIYLNYAYCYAVKYKDENIGLLCLSNENEIAIFIDPKYQQQGIGTIALKKFLSIIKEKYNVYKEVVAEITPDNDIAINVCHKLGFQDVNMEREVTINGKETVVKKYIKYENE